MNMGPELKDIWREIRELKRGMSKLPSRIDSSTGGSGGNGGDAGIPLYKRPSKEELPDNVEAWALGFVEDGTKKGAWYERNSDNNGWQGRTIWENLSE